MVEVMRRHRNTQLSPVWTVVGPLGGVLIGRVATAWQALAFIAVLVPLAVWDYWVGVFDTADGGVVVRRWWGRPVRLAAVEEPTLVVSARRWFGWRLDIETADGRRAKTGLSWWQQPNLDNELANVSIRVDGERGRVGSAT